MPRMYQTGVTSGLLAPVLSIQFVNTWLFGDYLSKQVKDMTEFNKVCQPVAKSVSRENLDF